MHLKKCIIWDLDNTLWDGVCLEGEVFIKSDVIEVIKKLDQKGILHSIASRSDENLSMTALEKFNIKDFFLVPKINWLQKSNNIVAISKELNISLDSIAFIDDDEFEIKQAAFMLPKIMTMNAKDINQLPFMPEFSPDAVTNETKNRRQFYQTEQLRKNSELNYTTREDFLISCNMKIKIRLMESEDIDRVQELMTRTHQLNTTGWIIEQDELQKILDLSKSTNIYVAELEDKFGSYGIIGSAITELIIGKLVLKYLAVSCRVMGRGIEQAIIIKLLNDCKFNGINYLSAEFHDTGRNKMMRALYQMFGFSLVENHKNNIDTLNFIRETENIHSMPKWLEVI